MNCCDANGHCNQGPDCPAQAPRVPVKRHTCDELGVCQSIACQDCDAFECELPCSPEPAAGELYPWPRYPFAPGTIEGPKPDRWAGFGEDGALLTRRENMSVLLLVLLLAVLGGVLGGFLAGYLPWPTWLTVGLPG